MQPANRKPAGTDRKLRTYDPARVRQALVAQVESVADAARGLSADQCARPSGLPGWDVHHLLVHIALQIDAVPRTLSGPEAEATAPEVSLSRWVLGNADFAGEQDEETRVEAARWSGGAELIDRAVADLEPVIEAAVNEELLVPRAMGAMRMLDFTLTRLVELTVHSDDLARATGDRVGLDRQALATTVRLLADALAARAPGGAVEVRIPPFAVVQAVEGPRHTRGTPPNVVETDPLTWIRLATGRTSWQQALESAQLTASGERADLSGLLPVLR